MAGSLALSALSLSLPAWATNPALQGLFFDACVNPTGALAARCGETTDAQGNLSGDSESSLNPSQPLSGNQLALRSALSSAEDARSRARADGTTEETIRVDIGRFSLLANYDHVWEDRSRVQDEDNERGYDADTDGVEVGFDYRLTDTAFAGVLIGYQALDAAFVAENPGTSFDPAGSAGSIDGETWGITGFLSAGLGTSAYLDFSAGYRWGENDYQRNSVFQESNRVIAQTNSVTKGSADTREFWGAVNGGWDLSSGAWTFGLAGGLTYTDSHIDGYRETDVSQTGLAMDVSSTDQNSLIGQLGLRVQYAIGTSFGVLIPSLRADYTHDFDGGSSALSAGYLLDASGNRLRLDSDDADTDYFTLGAALTAVLPNGWMPYIDVSGWVDYQDLDRYRVLVGLRKEL